MNRNKANILQIVLFVCLQIMLFVCFCALAILLPVILTNNARLKNAKAVTTQYNHTNNIKLITAELTTLREANEKLNDELSTTKDELKKLEELLNGRASTALSDDFELVCRIVAAEARGESFEGQQAVAQVIRDRYMNGQYGDSISEVVYAPYQFAAPWPGDLNEYPDIADAVTSVFNGSNVFDGEALYFFNPSTSNQEAVHTIRQSSVYFGIVGRHEFRGYHNE